MKKLTVLLVVGAVIIGGVLVAMPFLLWGEKSGDEISGGQAGLRQRETIVYSKTSPDGVIYDRLSEALREMTELLAVGSAVATTPVYGSNIIIAKDSSYWRTIPPGVVFLYDRGTAEVFIDQAEFGLFLKKHPELARAGARALKLDEFFRAFLNKETI